MTQRTAPRAAALALALATLAATPAAAQQEEEGRHESPFASISSYVLAFPIGDTHRYVPAPAWLGFSWEGHWALRRATLGGFAFNFHDFYDETEGTTDFPTGAITGLQRRGLVVVSAQASGRYFLGGRSWSGPFVGVAAGVDYTQQYYQVGVNSQFTRSNAHLVATPEVGSAFSVLDGIDLIVSARYHASSAGGDYLGGGARRFSFVSLSVGMAER